MTFEEFWDNAYYKGVYGNCEPYYGLAKYAFEVGQENPEWHDLRKNPDDLPKLEGDYLVVIHPHNRVCILSFSMVDGRPAWLDDDVDYSADFGYSILAWCELPKFEGE